MSDNEMNVIVNTFRNSDTKEIIGILSVNGIDVPVPFFGTSDQDVTRKAMSFYNDELLNTIQNYNFINAKADDNEAQKIAVEAFNTERPLVTAKSSVLSGTSWIHNKETGNRLRVKPEEIEKYLSEGWEKGRSLTTQPKEVKLSKHGHAFPLKGFVWYNNGIERLRIPAEAVAHFESQGYVKGRGTFTSGISAIEARIKDAETVQESA